MTRRLRARRLALLLALLLGCGAALAHATAVFGTLSSTPAAPRPGEAFTLRLELLDPSGAPVEDALVLAEFRAAPEGAAPAGGEGAPAAANATFAETATPGVYETRLELPAAGEYVLVLRDQTFRQEEVRAELRVLLSEEPLFPEGANGFLFPPTATTPRSIGTWLLWVVGVPILAGLVVTVLVLRSTPNPD